MPHFPIANYTIIPSTHKYERINFYLRSIDRNMRTHLCIVHRRRRRYYIRLWHRALHSMSRLATSLRLSLSLSLPFANMCFCAKFIALSFGNWKHTEPVPQANKIKLTSFSFCRIGTTGRVFHLYRKKKSICTHSTFRVSEKSIRVCLFFARNETRIKLITWDEHWMEMHG